MKHARITAITALVITSAAASCTSRRPPPAPSADPSTLPAESPLSGTWRVNVSPDEWTRKAGAADFVADISLGKGTFTSSTVSGSELVVCDTPPQPSRRPFTAILRDEFGTTFVWSGLADAAGGISGRMLVIKPTVAAVRELWSKKYEPSIIYINGQPVNEQAVRAQFNEEVRHWDRIGTGQVLRYTFSSSR